MVDEEVSDGEGIEGEATMLLDTAACALFLRLKNDLKVLPGDGERTVEEGEFTVAATCFLLCRVHVRRNAASGEAWTCMPIPWRLQEEMRQKRRCVLKKGRERLLTLS
jgi:hypothetical protein